MASLVTSARGPGRLSESSVSGRFYTVYCLGQENDAHSWEGNVV